MKKILVAGCTLKEQYRIKSFLRKNYLVEANPSIHNCVPNIRENNYDMILFNTENVVPFKVFMSEVKELKIETAVSALINVSDLNQIQRFQTLGAVSVIKKPFNKKRLLGGINKGFLYYEKLQAKKNKKKPEFTLTKKESNILICLKKHAILSHIRKEGLGLLLPASLEIGTKLLFSSPEFYAKIGLNYQKPPRINLEIESCIPIEDYQYKVETKFDLKDPICQDFYSCFQRYIEQHIFIPTAASDSKTILIAEADVFTRVFYQTALENKGYQLLFAFDGIQTLDILERQNVDMLVMDLLLPKLQGQEVLEIIQNWNIKIPVIISTGENYPEIVQKVKPYVLDYMVKPVSGKRFSEGIAAAFQTWGESFSKTRDEELSLQIQSDIDLMVAFKEHVKLLELSEDSLIFARHNPIVPGTTILLKTDAISIRREDTLTPSSTIEMGVTRCKHQKDSRYFVIKATFNTTDKSFL